MLILITLLVSAATAQLEQLVNLPAHVTDQVADVLYSSTPFTNIDMPKISHPNSTVYDWWYFDAASQASNASISVVFYAASPEGFLGAQGATTYLPVTIGGSRADGTPILLPPYSASNATVWTKNGDRGVRGVWDEQKFAFYTTDDLGQITIVIDAPEVGVSGTIEFLANAPPHYPCGLYGAPPTTANDLELLPGVGWANAMPDANVTVQLEINSNGTPIQLEFNDGIGYHDKNWGSLPFIEAVKTWYWGHGRIGEYSVVWFDARDSHDIEYHSGFVSRNGEVVSTSCQNTSVVVRPYGPGSGSDYPPTANSTPPDGYRMEFDVPGIESPLVVVAPNDIFLVQKSGYHRWRSNNLTASIGDRSLGSGTGEWEEFNIPALKKR